jgi:hypothetical protein
MTDFNKEFHMLAKGVRLTEAERSRVLAALRAAAVPRSVPSPFFASRYAFRFAVAFAVLVIMVGVGGGAAYAAQDALPGDALYPVKVAVTEPIEGALAASPEAKRAWNAKVAETRLDEAAALAKKGALTAATSEELAANFNAHAAAIPASDARFSSLVASKAGSVLAAGKESGNASSTVASGRLVLAIAERRALAPSMKKSVPAASAPTVTVMSAPAQNESAPAEEARSMMLMAPMMKASFAPAAPEDDDALVETLSVEAHGALDDATTTAASLASNGSIPDGIASKLSDLSSLVVTAEAERAVGSTTEAIDDFQTSLRLAAELELLMNGNAPSDAESSSDAAPSDAVKDAYPI